MAAQSAIWLPFVDAFRTFLPCALAWQEKMLSADVKQLASFSVVLRPKAFRPWSSEHLSSSEKIRPHYYEDRGLLNLTDSILRWMYAGSVELGSIANQRHHFVSLARPGARERLRLPDELWSAAAEVARKEGVSRTATELRVEWNELKRRMATATGVARQTAPPAFVESVSPQAQSFSECMIELEGRRCKLGIQLKGASASYLAALSRELWESAS